MGTRSKDLMIFISDDSVKVTAVERFSIFIILFFSTMVTVAKNPVECGVGDRGGKANRRLDLSFTPAV